MSDVLMQLVEAEELNQRIVARQRAAIEELERLKTYADDEHVGEIQSVIDTLKGRLRS